MIEDILEKIEQGLKANCPDVFASLRPPACPEMLRKFEQTCLAGGKMPEELRTLYQWHDGQDGYGSFNQNDNRTFLPVEQVIDAWAFLNDPMEDILEPIYREWIPISYNGAGDYLMYDLRDGTLRDYWHDDESRSLDSDSLEAWLQGVLASISDNNRLDEWLQSVLA